ncbi:hypothetical protein D3C84_836510 [compost metagenome]
MYLIDLTGGVAQINHAKTCRIVDAIEAIGRIVPITHVIQAICFILLWCMQFGCEVALCVIDIILCAVGIFHSS